MCNSLIFEKYLEVLLIGVQHPVEPGQELLGAVVAVQDDGHAVVLGHEADVVGARHRPEDGGPLTVVGDALAGVERGAAVRELDDDRRVDVASGLEYE